MHFISLTSIVYKRAALSRMVNLAQNNARILTRTPALKFRSQQLHLTSQASTNTKTLLHPS